MKRKAVNKRLKAIANLRAHIRITGEGLGQRLARRPAAPRDATFSYQPVFDHFDAELITVERKLITAEDRYVRDQIRLAGRRQTRDRATSGLYRRQHSARRLLIGLFRSSRGAQLSSIVEPTPQAGPALARQARTAIDFLRRLDPEAPLPLPGVKLHARALADKLEARLGKFEDARAALEDASTAADASRYWANHAIAEHDRVVPWVARAFESFRRLAGDR